MKILNLWERVIYTLGGEPGEFGFGILMTFSYLTQVHSSNLLRTTPTVFRKPFSEVGSILGLGKNTNFGE